MLETYLDYSLQDLMLFSPEVYFRSLATYNQNIWPAQLFAGLTSLYLGYTVLIKSTIARKTIGGIFALGWAWCGLVFHIGHYSTINWFAIIYGWLFLLQTVMIFWWALSSPNAISVKQENSQIYLAGKLVVILGCFIYPSLAYIEGNYWQMAQIFGLFPAPTLTTTIGIALMSQHFPKPLLIIPLIYAIIELLTAHLLKAPTWVIFLGLIIMLLIYLNKKNQKESPVSIS